jgi:hypothetical protein
MRRITVVAATAMITGSLAILSTGSASASPACVTKAEFGQVSHGMTRTHVAQIFDTDGRLTARVDSNDHIYTLRAYLPCTKESSVAVAFEDGKLLSKTAHWGALPQGGPLPAVFAGSAAR